MPSRGDDQTSTTVYHPRGALALVSQPLYAVALGHTNNAMYAVPFAQHPLRALYTFYIKSWETPSILLPLLLGLLLLLCIRERKYIPALLIYVLCERFSGSLDYGVGGIRLMILFYLFLEYPALCFAVTTAYMLAWALDGRGYPIFGFQFGMRLSPCRRSCSPACRSAAKPSCPSADLRLLPGTSDHFADSGKNILKKG